MKLGLTGGYATGKSFVAQVLERAGCYVLYADQLGHQVLQPDGEAYRPVVELFGEGILEEVEIGSKIDRKKLAALVFGDEGRLKELTDIVHPAVYRLQDRLMEEAQAANPDQMMVVEAAILVETGSYRCYDALLLTHCPEALQIERGMARDGLTREEVLARMGRQLPFEEKKRVANFVIDTSGTEDQTAKQVHAILQSLQVNS